LAHVLRGLDEEALRAMIEDRNRLAIMRTVSKKISQMNYQKFIKATFKQWQETDRQLELARHKQKAAITAALRRKWWPRGQRYLPLHFLS
jgi:hypothetical protein